MDEYPTRIPWDPRERGRVNEGVTTTNKTAAMTTPAERVWSRGGKSQPMRGAREEAERKEVREETQARRWWSTLWWAMEVV